MDLMNKIRHNRHEEALDILLTQDPDVDLEDDGMTPVLMATLKGWGDVVDVLVERGCNLGIKSGLGETPLMRAVKHAGISPRTIEKMILNGGLDTINAVTSEKCWFIGFSALHFASHQEFTPRQAVIALLVTYGADPYVMSEVNWAS